MRIGVTAILVLTLAWAGEARSWDAAGHEVIGAIADQLIAGTPSATRVRALVGVDLRTASVWADCVKGVSLLGDQFHYSVNARYPQCRPFEDAAGQARMVDYVARNWSTCHASADEEPCHKQYHYTDVAIERERYAIGEAGTSDHDIVAAIQAAIQVLGGHPAPAPFSIRDSGEALLLLAHCVGDLHQPLHVAAIYLGPDGQVIDPDHGAAGSESNTRGGNRLVGHGRLLHTAWDDIPSALKADRFALTGAAEARGVPATPGPVREWPVVWATDTLRVGRDALGGLGYGSENLQRHTWSATLPPDYDKEREAVQHRQLVLGGAHLAELLNKVLGHTRTASLP